MDAGPWECWLAAPCSGLRRLRPAELTDLLEDLRRSERNELLPL